MNITADRHMMAHLDYLGRITGLKNHDAIIAQSLSVTATALDKTSRGYLLRLFHQSVKQDWFDYPVNPAYVHIEMKRRAPDTAPGILPLSCDPAMDANVQTICKIMNITSPDDAIHFSTLFAHTIAQDLRKSPGLCRMSFADFGGRGQLILVDTPYDRTLRNEFNRLILEFRDKWAPDTKPKTAISYRPVEYLVNGGG